MRLALWTVSILSLFVLEACARETKGDVVTPTPAPTAGANQLVVSLSPTDEMRDAQIRITLDKSGHPKVDQPPAEKMVSGTVTVDGEKVIVFVPRKGPYPITSEKQHSFENTSTALSIDCNHNGKIDRNEKWWSSLPIRLGDQMFRVKAIDPGASWIVFEKTSDPLAGVVVGKPMLPLDFKATNGKQISLNNYKGKWLLLDVWSYT